MSLKNYYAILGISHTANADEIKTAYRELAKKYHPDKNNGNKSAEEYFKEIQQAYAVLSNSEKRKKYDLKMSYGNTHPKQRQSAPYRGNAYQYAQQQAQQKYQFHNTRPQPKENDKTENYYILISIGIALGLLYFIISYNIRKNRTESLSPLSTPSVTVAEKNNEIHDFDSPFTHIFGEEIYNDSKNSITIHNNSRLEAVVCLVKNQKPNQTIRNQYINTDNTFKMNGIPDGEYYLKVLYGKHWDTTKTYVNDKTTGRFTDETTFIKWNDEKSIFKMEQTQTGTRTSFSSYEISLDPYQKDGIQFITAEEFFE